MIATEGKQREYLNEWSFCCSLMVLKTGSGPVCLFVAWDPSILHQADDNLEAISEPDQLTNVCAGCRVRKRRNAWPVTNARDSISVWPDGKVLSQHKTINFTENVFFLWGGSGLPTFKVQSRQIGQRIYVSTVISPQYIWNFVPSFFSQD